MISVLVWLAGCLGDHASPGHPHVCIRISDAEREPSKFGCSKPFIGPMGSISWVLFRYTHTLWCGTRLLRPVYFRGIKGNIAQTHALPSKVFVFALAIHAICLFVDFRTLTKHGGLPPRKPLGTWLCFGLAWKLLKAFPLNKNTSCCCCLSGGCRNKARPHSVSFGMRQASMELKHMGQRCIAPDGDLCRTIKSVNQTIREQVFLKLPKLLYRAAANTLLISWRMLLVLLGPGLG